MDNKFDFFYAKEQSYKREITLLKSANKMYKSINIVLFICLFIMVGSNTNIVNKLMETHNNIVASASVKADEVENNIINGKDIIEEIEEVNETIREPIVKEVTKTKHDIIEDEFSYVKLNIEQINYIIDESNKNEINPHILFILFNIKSGFDIDSKHDNYTSRGLGQITEATGRWIYEDLIGKGKNNYNHDMALDYKINTNITIRYLKYLQDVYDNDWIRIFQSYNGEKNTQVLFNEINESLLTLTNKDIDSSYDNIFIYN